MEAVMSPPPPSINGENLNPAELKEIILKTDHPFVIRNCIASWGAIKWSLAEFTELFGRIETRFKLHRKKTKVNTFCDGEPPNKAQRLVLDTEDKVPMETECVYQNGTFADFWDWLHGNNKNTLLDYPREHYWCYADYNYMVELFNSCDAIMDCVDWSKFGFDNRNGRQSTIWVGSEGAFTPCHKDTYGLNIVAQIDGVKRWLLLPPQDEQQALRPRRIPYEESSVFTDLNSEQLLKVKSCVQVDLRAGEVLVVPKHWWHYVEHLVPSLSINTWLELESDKDDRVQEALTQTLVYALRPLGSGGSPNTKIEKWLNPGQEIPSSLGECIQLLNLALQDDESVEENIESSSTPPDVGSKPSPSSSTFPDVGSSKNKNQNTRLPTNPSLLPLVALSASTSQKNEIESSNYPSPLPLIGTVTSTIQDGSEDKNKASTSLALKTPSPMAPVTPEMLVDCLCDKDVLTRVIQIIKERRSK